MIFQRWLYPMRWVGKKYESAAAAFLKKRGWKLLHRNYSCRLGEVDLIFRDLKGAIVFVEVKFRFSRDFGSGEEFVGAEKQKRLARAALFYIKEKNLEGRDFRFDVAAVSPKGIEHIPNAFSPEGYTL